MKKTILITMFLAMTLYGFSQISCGGGLHIYDGKSMKMLIPFNNIAVDGAELTYTTDFKYNEDIWNFIEDDYGYYSIIHKPSNLRLEIKDDIPNENTKIILSKPNGNDKQKWKIIANSQSNEEDLYIMTKVNDDFYLSIVGGNIVLHKFSQEENICQIWGTGLACPFVYVKQDNSYLFVGEIIKNQVSIASDSYDNIEIPFDMITDNSLTIKITEEKDEISFIDHIYLQIGNQILYPETSTTIFDKIKTADRNYYEIQKGEHFELKFALPANICNTDKINLFAKGYYIPTDYTVNK